MNRILCVIALTLGMTGVTGLQTAYAASLPQMDSSAFTYQYEMDVDPTSGGDFTWNSTPGTVAAGILTLVDQANNYFYGGNVLSAGTAWGNVTFETGFTLEASIEAYQSGTSSTGFVVNGGGYPTYGYLHVAYNNVSWGPSVLGTQTILASGLDNWTSFHQFRVAQLPGEDSYSVWRDGELLASDLTTCAGFDLGNEVAIGGATVNEFGATPIDYVRFTAGAYAPVPEPTTLVLLATSLIGLVAYAWRKRG